MDSLLLDIRYALRSLWRARLVTAIAIVCLAVGIGTNTAVFSVVHGILFRSLPFVDGERIVAVMAANDERGVVEGGLTFADLEALRASGAYTQVEGIDDRSFTLTGGAEAERVQGSVVTPGLFAMLGVQPQLGRHFRAEEAGPAGFEQAVMLSDGLWRRRFGAAPDIVGRTVHINGREITVVGVMPPGFRFPEVDELWLPLGSLDAADHRARFVVAVARLDRGVSLASAQARAGAAADRLAQEFAGTHQGWRFNVMPFRHTMVDAAGQQTLLVMLGAVAFVLLIACANVANLLLARAADRQREISVRAALGASRARVVRLFLTESVLLSLMAAALGVLLAIWWVDAMVSAIPEEMAYWVRIAVDAPVLLYTVIVAVSTGLLFGTLPALQAARVDLHRELKEGSRAAGAGTARVRLRNILVTGEIAMAVVLLVSAALMMQSFLQLQRADPGFDDSNMLSLRVVASGDQFDDVHARVAFYERAVSELASVPGVLAAAATVAIPADDGGPAVSLRTDDDERAGDRALGVTLLAATRSLFDVLDVPVEGRAFTATEATDTAAHVAIIGRTLAARLWPDASALGRRVRLGNDGEEELTIVGIVPDLQYEEFGEANTRAQLQLYVPYSRRPYRQMALLLRTRDEAARYQQDVRAALRRAEPTAAAFDMLTMQQRRRFTTWPQRVFGQLFAQFGATALILALIGVYGVMAYAVTQRRREIGIRVALGARPADVLRDVIGHALRLGAIGTVAGTLGALLVVRMLQAALFGVRATDPLTFLAVPAAMMAAALLAGALPARRAARIDPLDALRSE